MALKIISGGQTGVDRAALDWAINHNIDHGGWCPLGRRAEDGVIPAHYMLQETVSRNYPARTKQNIRDADATLIISKQPELTGGSLFTYDFATKIDKPCLHVHPNISWRNHIKTFFVTHVIRIFNVAGPRSSNAPDINQFVKEVLDYVEIIQNEAK